MGGVDRKGVGDHSMDRRVKRFCVCCMAIWECFGVCFGIALEL